MVTGGAGARLRRSFGDAIDPRSIPVDRTGENSQIPHTADPVKLGWISP